jgi:hypothetical protein
MVTAPGDVVMDPFNGAGASTKAAYDLGRIGLGFDLEPKYIDYAWKRRELPSAVRRQQLVIRPEAVAGFEPGRSRGRTRHGAGLAARGASKRAETPR